MSRPKKQRKICAVPGAVGFCPAGSMGKGAQNGECCAAGDNDCSDDIIELTLDEYETVRLIDLLGYSQVECAEQMGVARTTAQMMYDSARKKLAQMLADGKSLVIRGGSIIICPRSENCSCRKGNLYENCSYTRQL